MKTKEDMQRLLSVSPDPAQVVVLRKQQTKLDELMSSLRAELVVVREKAGEAERTRDSFRSDNLRLTHRISYLEEQVSDLLDRTRDEIVPQSPVTSSASSVKSLQISSSSPKPEVQVFQKGPQVTALISNLPGLEVGSKSPPETRNNLPTVRSKHSTASSKASEEGHPVIDSRSVKSLDLCLSEIDKIPRARHSKKRDSNLHNARSTNSLDIEPTSLIAKNHQHNSQQYLEKTASVGKSVLDYNSETLAINRKCHSRRHSESHQLQLEQRQRHLRDARTSLFDYAERDKRSAKSLDFDSEPSYTRPNMQNHNSKHIDMSSQKSLDYSSESSLRHYKKHPEQRIQRPIPPKKPLRLSLHRATSLQSVETGDKKPMKRNYKGEAPAIPQSPLCWPGSLHSTATFRCKSSLGEKWC